MTSSYYIINPGEREPMLAPSPGSPTPPAHHAESKTPSAADQLRDQRCEVDAPRLSGQQAPPTCALEQQRRSSGRVCAVALASSGRRPAPFPDRLPTPTPACFPVDGPRSRSGRRLLRLWRAAKCVSAAAGAFGSVFRLLGSGGGEGLSRRGPPGVGKGF